MNQEKGTVIGVTVVGLVIVAILGWGVWEQIDRLRRIRAMEAELLPLVVYEKERQAELVMELKHVSSPTYPEEWARIYGGMTGSGEVRLVVPLDEPTPSPQPPPSSALSSPSFWDRLWRWLSGE
jgi:hypothetical protein